MSSRFQRPPMRGPVAPIHRGPQALPPGASANPAFGGYYNAHAPNAALLIDFDNVTMGIQKDMQSELRNLLSSDIIKGKVSVQRAYADWRRYPGYIVPLTEASIDLIFAPAYGSAKKNATDIRLAIDAMELVFTRPEIGTFILLSGDSDFSSLVIKLKEYGKYVIGVGIRESSSDLLVQNCDEYYSYNALAGLVKSGDEESVRWDPWELVVEAVGRMVRNGDVMRADRLKQVMQDIDPNFDEKDLGMSKFSRFVHEAEKRGLLTLTRQENGQYEIGQVARAGTPLAPKGAAGAAEPLSDAPDRAERDRADRDRDRGRRGRRGRGRDRERGRGEIDGVLADLGLADDVEVPREAEKADAPPAPIGTGGERITRAEAFDLVRRATESLTRDENDAVSMREVRVRAFELLGRDSESLGERMFERILKDAHDADVVDLRRRGDDFEVSRSAKADSVVEQLNRAAAAAQADAPGAAVPAGPRGMGPRGGGPRGGGRAPSGRGAPPPELLSIGVVQTAAPAAAAAASAAPAPASPEPSRDEVPAPVAPVVPVAADTPRASGPAAVAASAGTPPAREATAAPPAVPPAVPRGRGPARRGAPPPELLSIGVVAPPAPLAPAAPAVTAPAPAAPTLAASGGDADAAPTADEAAPARGGRGRGGRGRGRGGRAAQGTTPTPPAVASDGASNAPAAPTVAVAPAAPAPPAPKPGAAPGDGAPSGGRGGAKQPTKRGAKTAAKGGARVAKTPAKSAARTPAAAPAPAAVPAPGAPPAGNGGNDGAGGTGGRGRRGGGRKTAAKRAG